MSHGSCSACGKRFYSAIAEARHRHNFPALCVRSKRFARWADDANKRSMREKIEAMPIGALFVGVWMNGQNDNIYKGAFEVRAVLPVGEVTVKCLINCLGAINEIDLNDSGTALTVWLENKLRIEPIPPERWEGFHMLLAKGLAEAACKLVNGPEVLEDVR